MIGQVLKGRYAVSREIGRGGMGVVYEAVLLDLGRRVALKVLELKDVSGLEDPNVRARVVARFRQEALAAASVHHPNVISVSDFDASGDADAQPFIVMELLEGGASLDVLLRKSGAGMPWKRAVAIIAQVLDGLSATHAVGIIHRDIKPSNIFVIDLSGGANHLVKVLDFGIAKFSEAENRGGVRTTTGTFLGSMSYSAPEQILGSGVDPRTDVHAVSVVLYEMLAGQRAFRATSSIDIVTSVLKTDPPKIVRDDVPPALADVVARGLAKDKAARWPTAAAMREALQPWLITGAEPAPPPAPPPPEKTRRKPFLMAFLATFGIAAIAGAGAFASHFFFATTPPLLPSSSPSASQPPNTVIEVEAPDAALTTDAEPPEPLPTTTTSSPPPLFVFVKHEFWQIDEAAGEAWYRQHELSMRQGCQQNPICGQSIAINTDDTTNTWSSPKTKGKPACAGGGSTKLAGCFLRYVEKHPLPPPVCDGGACQKSHGALTLYFAK